MTIDDQVTVLLLTSPIPSHPSTAILDETLASVRHWLPRAEVLLLADGVRPEQEDRRADYCEALRRHLWDCANRWERVTPVLSPEHRHQSGMLRLALPMVRTPLLLFMEGDCPLVTDCPIEWEGIAAAILSGELNLVRLNHEAHLFDEHAHLHLDRVPIDVHGVPMVRTAQFSARPHLASVAWYRQMMETWFSPEARCFIEDRIHGPIQTAYTEEGVPGWALHRLAIYHPPGGNIKRSVTTDGRQGGPKWDDLQVF